MKIIDIIKNRYSTVTFSTKPVEDKKINLLFEAVRWSPSAYNEQPWRFIVGRKGDNDQNYDKLLDSLVDANRYWAHNAPLLVLVVSKKIFSHNSAENKTAKYDTGMAVGNLLAQATSMNLFVHQMGGFSKEKVINEFEIPENFEPIVVMAIGYKGNAEGFPDDLQVREKKERIRKSADDFYKFV